MVTDKREFNNEIQNSIGKAKNIFQKICKLFLRVPRMSLKKMKIEKNISAILYNI